MLNLEQEVDSMNRKLLGFLCVLGIAVVYLASCESGNEEKRTVVTIAAINDNVPFFSDVLEQGDSVRRDTGQWVTNDDYIKEDNIKVTFYNRPYSAFVFTGAARPYGEYLVTRYRVEWERAGGGQVPPVYNGATSVLVPTEEYVEAYILLVPFEVKNLPFIWELNYLGANAGEEILCTAHLTFWGHEVGTDRETMFEGSVSVNFADWVMKSKKDY
jgi:hypothetical protein